MDLSGLTLDDIAAILDFSKVKKLANHTGSVVSSLTRRQVKQLRKSIDTKKEGLDLKKFFKKVFIIIGVCAAIAGIAFALYKYFTPDYEDEFDDDFDDAFEDDDEDLFEEKA